MIEEKGIKMYVEKVRRSRNPAWRLLAASRQKDQTPETKKRGTHE
jgi:hypothetical protein